MSLETIIGHERPVNILKRALANNTLAHAYLFSGEDGVGKKLTAVAVAAAVNCAERGPGGGCGACPSCRKTASFGHPDIHVVAADGQEIKIDQIRQVQAGLALKPFEGMKKVLIVDGADALNDAAANAFLKTLEEPPGDTLIILVTSLPQSMLPTIRSRCQEIRFLPLSRRALSQVLVERRGLSEEDAWFVAALAKGSLGRAIEMNIEEERAAREDVRRLWLDLRAMSPAEVLAQAEPLSKDRRRLERLLDVTVEGIRDTLVLSATGDESLLVNAGEKDRYTLLAGQFSFPRMLADIELLNESRRLLDRRVSAQLVTENLLLKLGRG